MGWSDSGELRCCSNGRCEKKFDNSLVEKYEPENEHYDSIVSQSETVPWKANMTQQHLSVLFLYSTETLTDTAFQLYIVDGSVYAI